MKMGKLILAGTWILAVATAMSGPTVNAQGFPHWDNAPYLSANSQNMGFNVQMLGSGEYVYTVFHGSEDEGKSASVWRWSPCVDWEPVIDEGTQPGDQFFHLNAIAIWHNYLYAGGSYRVMSGPDQGSVYSFVQKLDLVTGQLTFLPIVDPQPPPGLPPSRSVQALAVDSSGNVYIGFDSVYTAGLGGIDPNLLLKWDGQTLSTVGGNLVADLSGHGITALVADGTTIYAGGNFSGVQNGIFFYPSSCIIGWNGAGWIQLGGIHKVLDWDTLFTYDILVSIKSIVVAPGAGGPAGPKTIVVAGNFNAVGDLASIGEQPGVARFLAEPALGFPTGWPVTTDGLWWTDNPGTSERDGTALAFLNGVVYVTGGLYNPFNLAGTTAANGIARLTDLHIQATGNPAVLHGQAWTALDSGLQTTSGNDFIPALGLTLAANDTAVLVGGMYGAGFTYAGGLLSPNIARWMVALDPAPTPPGLVAWWKGEYNANDSQLVNNGTLKNGTGFSQGKVAAAFNLDGVDDYVDVPSSPELKFTGPFSIETWIKYDHLTGANGDTIVAKGQDAEVAADWMLVVNGNQKLRPGVFAGGGWHYFDCTTPLVANTWYHVALVYDGTQLKGYVNGVLNGSVNVSGAVRASDNPLRIGSYAPHGTVSKAFFAGQIDELSLYNRALSSQEIQSIFQADISGKCPPPCAEPPVNLVSWWQAADDPIDWVSRNDATPRNGAGYGPGFVVQPFVLQPSGRGRAFNLDGVDDYFEVPSADNLKFTGPFSIEAWINYDHITGTSSDAIVSKGVDAEVAIDWTMTVSQGKNLRPAVHTTTGWHYFDCNTVLTAGRWYHVAMVYDGAHLQGFVDGVLDGSVNVTGVVQTSDDSLKIGAYAPVNGTASKGFFAGQIDELSLYNRALAPSEVRAICLAGRAGKCLPPPPPPPPPSQPFIDVDFGGGPAPSPEAGPAAIGTSATDFWNDFNQSYMVGSGSLPNLKTVSGSSTSVGITVNNAPGGWGNNSVDPMYNDFIYPFSGGNITVTLTDLPVGSYDLYLYCHDGNYQVISGGTDYGTKTCRDVPVINPPYWLEGMQYARFQSVLISTPGQSVVITVRPGADNLAVISGLQVVPRQ